MTLQITQFKDIRPQPWRNAGGSTRELVAWPDAAAWQWRVSVAEVIESGPFSDFTGIQRWFAVLKGDGVCLTVDGYMHMLSKSDQPLAFDGGASTSCELLGGPSQDLNLMVQSGIAARMQRVSGSFKTTTSAPKIIAACAHSKKAKVQIGTEIHELTPHSFGWTQVAASVDIAVQSRDVLWLEIDI